jgi:iron complex outermembrane recepter protein
MIASTRLIRNRRSLSASVAAVALIAGAAPALAQTPAAAEEAGEIVVTGFRASLESAAREKKKASQIVESVTAEDIGKLPDASIAESIARLPGLTSQRLSGRSNVISIRGLGPDLSMTLLNGREQTTTGDSRAAEFDQYPSEIVNQVVVYKSPTANLIGQGLAGTVDIRTIRPLDAGKRIIALGARGVYTDLGAVKGGSKDKGYRVNGTFVDQFADDTIGVALSGSYINEPYQIQEFNAWGYAGDGTTASPAVIGGSKSFVTSTVLKRLGLSGTVQFRPQPELTVTLDGFYSNFSDDQSKKGIELPLGFLGFGTKFNPATATVRNGQYVAGTFTNVQGVVRNDVTERKADLYSFGFNTKWEGDDGWNALFDFGYSRTDRTELILESYSGTGFGEPLGATDTIGFTSTGKGTIFKPTLNYSDTNLIKLTDPLGWGGGVVPQAGYSNNRVVKDDLKQFRLQVEREMEGSFISAVKVGYAFTNRNKRLTPNEALIRLKGGALELPIPTNRLQTPTNLSFLGLGPVVSYDPRQLIADGTLVLEKNVNKDILSKAYVVSEQLMHAFAQADISQDIGAAKLTGNIGGQFVITKQSSSGVYFQPGNDKPLPRTYGANYVDFLPSLNLALELPGQWVVRLAASREIQRPRIDDMRVALAYGYDQTLGFLKGSGGNPFLQPYRANAFDFNVEKYFAKGGYISAQLFYKDLKNFVFKGDTFFDFAGLPLPANYPPGGGQFGTFGILETVVNTGGGHIAGAELSTTIPFGAITEALDGFGVTGGVGYTDTQVTNIQGKIQSIPGYSDWTANGTLYFEKAGFSARGSVRYRSAFLGEVSGFGGSRDNRQAVAETIVDAQIGYDFKDIGPLSGLSLFLQGQNLTNSAYKTVTKLSAPTQVIDYQTYGRRFYVGASLKF